MRENKKNRPLTIRTIQILLLERSFSKSLETFFLRSRCIYFPIPFVSLENSKKEPPRLRGRLSLSRDKEK